jgi:hypothetical protein
MRTGLMAVTQLPASEPPAALPPPDNEPAAAASPPLPDEPAPAALPVALLAGAPPEDAAPLLVSATPDELPPGLDEPFAELFVLPPLEHALTAPIAAATAAISASPAQSTRRLDSSKNVMRVSREACLY